MQIDKRIIKTRTSIKSAFMELVEKSEMSKISVSDLAAKALVNRSTFYLHYTDVADVAADIEMEIETRISQNIDDFDVSDIYGSVYSLFKKLTGRLDENELIKRYIFYSTNSENVSAKLKEIFVEKTKSSILNIHPHLREENIIYQLTFAAAGVVDCYSKWVRAGDSAASLEKVISEVSKITERIISDITNV